MEPPGGYKPCEEATEANVEMAEHLCEIISDEDGKWKEWSHQIINRVQFHKACKHKNLLCTDKYCLTKTGSQPKLH